MVFHVPFAEGKVLGVALVVNPATTKPMGSDAHARRAARMVRSSSGEEADAAIGKRWAAGRPAGTGPADVERRNSRLTVAFGHTDLKRGRGQGVEAAFGILLLTKLSLLRYAT